MIHFLFNIWVWLFPLAIVCGITGCILAHINGKHKGENWMWSMTGIMVVWLFLTIFFIYLHL